MLGVGRGGAPAEAGRADGRECHKAVLLIPQVHSSGLGPLCPLQQVTYLSRPYCVVNISEQWCNCAESNRLCDLLSNFPVYLNTNGFESLRHVAQSQHALGT